MKKLFALLFFIPILAQSQKLLGGKNIVKMSMSSLALNNYHFTYERHIYKNLSFSLSYRTMPKGAIPYQSEIQNQINSNEINFSNFAIGNSAITPELRIYLSMSKMKGFYFAPYARFANFDVSVPIKYTSNGTVPPASKDAIMDGKIKSTSAGLMIGYQFQLFKKLALDFQIIGGHYGNSKGDLVFSAPLNTFEQQALRDNLNSLDVSPFKFTSNVNASGAQINVDGPWAGIRAINLGLGFRF
ncbi:MAG: DUF3575 domain-containing protein [Sediminibacterium sp.]|nr:MAG: hypothetical protein FD183_1717 [Chitinophagaceae bacterium]MDP1844239.1 DUF3575 domain-containing protein [Sediminibacterium sp.]